MINKTELFRKIGGILAELNDQYQYIAENPASLNELELELLAANADFLSDHVKILKKLSEAKADKPAANPAIANHLPAAPTTQSAQIPFSQDEKVEKNGFSPAPAANETSEPEPVVPAEKPSQPVLREVEAAPVPVVPVSVAETVNTPPVMEERLPEIVKEPVIPEVVVPVVSEPQIQPEPQRMPEPVAPVQQPPVRTLNDIISGQRSQDSVAGKFSHQPVKDLKSIISLNDKLLFIKELFNGYSLAYSEAIEILNRFDSFEAADSFLQSNYAGKNSWNTKESTVEKLYEILRRRFGQELA